jgi:hypothetical protein
MPVSARARDRFGRSMCLSTWTFGQRHARAGPPARFKPTRSGRCASRASSATSAPPSWRRFRRAAPPAEFDASVLRLGSSRTYVADQHTRSSAESRRAFRVGADDCVSSKGSAAAAQQARSFLYECRRRLPGAGRRCRIIDRVCDVDSGAVACLAAVGELVTRAGSGGWQFWSVERDGEAVRLSV